MSDLLIEPDFSEIAEEIGAGTYRVRVVEGKPGKWEGKDGKPDTPFINWRMETFGSSEPRNNGRSIFHRTPYTGKGAFRFQQFYKAAMGEECKGKFDLTMLYGREVEVTYGPQTNNPQYMEVKAVKALNS